MKEGWQRKNINDYCEIVAGQSPNGKHYNSDGQGMPFYQGKKDFGGKFIQAPTTWTTEITKIAREGDILMSVRAPVGPVNFATEEICIGRGLAAIRSNGKLDRDFLYYQLLYLQPEIAGREGAVFASINKSEIAALPISFAPLPEQQRIVGILDQAFASIATAKANAEKNLQNARALFDSHLQSVFAQRGEGWVERRLGEICERVSVGHVGPTSDFYCSRAEGIPFLRSQNVRRGYLDWSGVQFVTKDFHQRLRKSQLRPGDLLFVRVGANRGDCCSVPVGVGNLNCANIVFARPSEGNAPFLERYCDSTHGREQLLGMTTGSAQGVINTSSVAELIVPLPPLPEQMRIVEYLNDFQAETKRLSSIYQQKLAALEALKKSLLHDAFRGAL